MAKQGGENDGEKSFKKRETRVVFPSGDAAKVWTVLIAIGLTWTAWVSHTLFEMNKGVKNSAQTCKIELEKMKNETLVSTLQK